MGLLEEISHMSLVGTDEVGDRAGEGYQQFSDCSATSMPC
jgi:hypothetical protein